jgi:hypothetical protein
MRLKLRFGFLLFALVLLTLHPTAFAVPTCGTCPEVSDGPDDCGGTAIGPWEFTGETQKGDWEGRKWAESNGTICFHYTEIFTEYDRSFHQDSGCPPDDWQETQSDFSGLWERRAWGDESACCAAFGCD